MLKSFNFLSYPKWYISHFTRTYRTKIRPDPRTATDSEKRMVSYMRKHFEEHGLMSIVNQVPENFLKRSKYVDYCTVVDPKLARRIVFSICSRLDEGCVVESDPGFGFMSRILASLVPQLFLCERNEDFRSKLKDLEMKQENVQITKFNVYSLLKMIRCIQEEPITEVTDFYQAILNKRNANDSQRINWIFTSLSKYSIRNLCFLHFNDSSFQQLGKMTYYITLPSTLYKILTEPFKDDVQVRNAFAAVLFQIIFDWEVLMTGIPRKMFLPWSTEMDPNEELLLMRVTPKNVETIFDSDLLAKSFVKFLFIGLKKKRRVIPVLEKYVSNCGPLFILEHDITIYTEFLELSPEKLLSLFKSFSKLPEFSHSTFIDEDTNEYSDEPAAGERNLNDEVDHFEDDAECEEDEDCQSENDKSNESEERNS